MFLVFTAHSRAGCEERLRCYSSNGIRYEKSDTGYGQQLIFKGHYTFTLSVRGPNCKPLNIDNLKIYRNGSLIFKARESYYCSADIYLTEIPGHYEVYCSSNKSYKWSFDIKTAREVAIEDSIKNIPPPIAIASVQVIPSQEPAPVIEEFILSSSPENNNIYLANGSQQIYSVAIYDLNGKLSGSYEFYSPSATISLAGLPSGMYVLYATLPEKIMMKKFFAP